MLFLAFATPVYGFGCGAHCRLCPSCIVVNSIYPCWCNDTCVTCRTLYKLRPYLDRLNMNCVGSCPDNAPVLVMSALECMTCEQYNADTPYWNKADKKCYSRCPDSAPVAVFDACTPCMNVSSSTPFYDRASGSCVAKCPQSSPVHDSDSICQTCQSGTFYDQQSNSCISYCGEYVENEVCVSECTSGVYRTESD